MLNAKRHITQGARFRIMLLLLLSLVSAMPDVTPDGMGRLMARAPESIHHENEIPEACQVSLRLEAQAARQQVRRQHEPAGLAVCPEQTTADRQRNGVAWPRPAYYAHLHRYSLY